MRRRHARRACTHQTPTTANAAARRTCNPPPHRRRHPRSASAIAKHHEAKARREEAMHLLTPVLCASRMGRFRERLVPCAMSLRMSGPRCLAVQVGQSGQERPAWKANESAEHQRCRRRQVRQKLRASQYLHVRSWHQRNHLSAMSLRSPLGSKPAGIVGQRGSRWTRLGRQTRCPSRSGRKSPNASAAVARFSFPGGHHTVGTRRGRRRFRDRAGAGDPLALSTNARVASVPTS